MKSRFFTSEYLLQRKGPHAAILFILTDDLGQRQTQCSSVDDMEGKWTIRQGFEQVLLTWTLAAACAMTAMAQTVTVTTLHNFTGSPDGANPVAPLVQGLDGKFYGTTLAGGTSSFDKDFCYIYFGGCGTFFSIDTSGNVSILYNFCNATCSDRLQPISLIEGSGGAFFGTTNSTAFKMTSKGTETTFFSFCPGCTVGGSIPARPISLIWSWNGGFYGASSIPVVNTTCATVFRLTQSGVFSPTPGFCKQPGGPPQGLVQATDGNIYGVGLAGGNSYNDQTAGTVFKISSSGVQTIYEFCSQTNCADGARPNGLVEGNDGNFYGTTQEGGANRFGTFFKITPTGVLTTLYDFCSMEVCLDGGNPFPIILASDGNFYGSTQLMGAFFQLTPSGSYSFFYTNGAGPNGLLVQGTDGAFYGTGQGGINGGTVFRVNTGLSPFVRPVVPFGKVGRQVTILGLNLKEAKAVSFNGTPATFKVASSTAIFATVPQGATSGTITVTTSSGTLKSTPAFTVVP